MARGWSIAKLIATLKPILTGWINYFILSEVKRIFQNLDGWLRRRIRCIIWRHWKIPRSRAKGLMRQGIERITAYRTAFNGYGQWRMSGYYPMNYAFPKLWFDNIGLISLADKVLLHHNTS